MVRCINNTHRLAFNLQTEGETRHAERTHSAVKLQQLVTVRSLTADTNITELFQSESAVQIILGTKCRTLPGEANPNKGVRNK